MRSITLLLMVFGLSLAPASGATLWMQFEGGGNVATLAPSDSINVEIWVDLLPGDSLGALVVYELAVRRAGKSGDDERTD